MKKFSLFMAAAVMLFLMGCSNDEIIEQRNVGSVLKVSTSDNEILILTLGEVLDNYMIKNKLDETNNETIVDNVVVSARSNNNFLNVNGNSLIHADVNDYTEVIDAPDVFIRRLNISGEAISRLTNFFNDSFASERGCEDLLNQFISEISLTNVYEKENIIMSCQLAIQANKNKGKVDDDWMGTASVMASALSGSLESPAQAVLNAAVVTALTL